MIKQVLAEGALGGEQLRELAFLCGLIFVPLQGCTDACDGEHKPCLVPGAVSRGGLPSPLYPSWASSQWQQQLPAQLCCGQSWGGQGGWRKMRWNGAPMPCGLSPASLNTPATVADRAHNARGSIPPASCSSFRKAKPSQAAKPSVLLLPLFLPLLTALGVAGPGQRGDGERGIRQPP